MRNFPETRLSLSTDDTSVPDGTYYGIATWSTKARDYVDQPGIYESESEARKHCPMGTRTVRWTVFRGLVTTRKGLR